MKKHSFLKSVLVTGAARRIGRAIALDLAKSGWSVAIHCNRSIEAAEDLVSQILNLGVKARLMYERLRAKSEI